MIRSMTGFGARAQIIPPFGKISVEMRSTNHKFLEIISHLPEGFIALEDRIKETIEAKIKRGRLVCVVNIVSSNGGGVFVNYDLLGKYVAVLKKAKQDFPIQGEINVDTLIHLPGVLSLAANVIPKDKAWPSIKPLVVKAVEELVNTRSKEGRALHGHLKSRVKAINVKLEGVKARFNKVMKEKISRMNSDDERSSFLKSTDITEEIERLAFHSRNLTSKLAKNGPIGKELDFIAQEMQREANTMGAKSCDSGISSKVVEIKSQVEKIREQVQNIE